MMSTATFMQAGSKDPGDRPVGENHNARDPGPTQKDQLVRAQAIRHCLRTGLEDVHPGETHSLQTQNTKMYMPD
jgi:hypothetical protein